LKRLGGKANLSRWIIRHLPRHESFIEVFGGSAPVLVSKQRARGQEVYNDLDGLWTNSWRCLRDHNEEMADLIHGTPYGRAEFLHARDSIRHWRQGELQLEPLELARLHMVVVRQSFSADGGSWSTCSFGGENRPRLWARLPFEICMCLERIRGVHIEQKDYRYILHRYDHERAAFYLDPPYDGVEDKYYDVNRQDGFDHEALRSAVVDLKGSVVISYYKREGIVELYAGWRCERKSVVVHAGDEKREETELLFIRESRFGHRSRRRRDFDLFPE
jgi:DNA adenine methylase